MSRYIWIVSYESPYTGERSMIEFSSPGRAMAARRALVDYFRVPATLTSTEKRAW